MKPKYMMATTATHKLGDLSRSPADICQVSSEDAANYYGSWVTGFGFVGVQFPKQTTRELTAEELDRFHGMELAMNGEPMCALNLTGEDFAKRVTVTHTETGRVRKGTLIAPIKRAIIMATDEGRQFRTSPIERIDGNTVYTKNSVYIVEYDDRGT